MFVINRCVEATDVFYAGAVGLEGRAGRSAETFPKHHIVIGNIIKIINIRR